MAEPEFGQVKRFEGDAWMVLGASTFPFVFRDCPFWPGHLSKVTFSPGRVIAMKVSGSKIGFIDGFSSIMWDRELTDDV